VLQKATQIQPNGTQLRRFKVAERRKPPGVTLFVGGSP
jgi:hypothetical protein